MSGRQDYEERKQARIEKLENAADKARKRSAELYRKSEELVSCIPMGQPVITGRGARTRADINRREKSWNKVGQAISEKNNAEHYDEKAEAAENNKTISADDPNSILKLQEKIDSLKKTQEYEKALNIYYRKNKTCKGFRDLQNEEAEKMDEKIKNRCSWDEQPYPSYELTSINGKIKAAQARIEQIQRIDQMPDETIKYDFGEIEVSSEINRVIIRFNEKQNGTVFDKLTSHGFRWSYTASQFQRLKTKWALYDAKQIMEGIKK